MTTTPDQITSWMTKRVNLAEKANDEVEARAMSHADAEHAYKLGYAKAIVSNQGKDVSTGRPLAQSYVESLATIETERELRAHLMAKNLYQSSLEASRTKRDAIGAMQTVAGVKREEWKATMFGPQVTP